MRPDAKFAKQNASRCLKSDLQLELTRATSSVVTVSNVTPLGLIAVPGTQHPLLLETAPACVGWIKVSSRSCRADATTAIASHQAPARFRLAARDTRPLPHGTSGVSPTWRQDANPENSLGDLVEAIPTRFKSFQIKMPFPKLKSSPNRAGMAGFFTGLLVLGFVHWNLEEAHACSPIE